MRLLLFLVSWLLWLAAWCYRGLSALEGHSDGSGARRAIMVGLVATLAYTAWRTGLEVTDTQWMWGWRK